MELQKIAEIVKKASYFSGVIQIVEKGDIKLNLAAGYAKREDELDNTTDTAFGIASGTKGFTALGILRLVDQKKLSLEDRVFDLLPYDFPNMHEDVTVKHLLSHTSGIFDYFDEDLVEDFGQLFEKVPVHKILGPKDMLPLLIEGEGYFKPGTKYKYCNSGFVLLGMLIEVVSGMDYADYIHKEVCQPLGLSRTGCYKTNQLPKNCANGYIQDDQGVWYSNIFEIPMVCTGDGGLYTTAEDVSAMWQQLMTDDFLSKTIRTKMFDTQAHIDGDWCENLHYGLGFYVQKNKEGKATTYYLEGGDPGVSFSSTYYIEKERIVTILSNTSDGADDLRDEIAPYIL